MPQYDQAFVLEDPGNDEGVFGQESLAISDDGDLIVVGARLRQRAYLFNGPDLAHTFSASSPPEDYGTSVAISPDGSTIAVGAPDDLGGEGKVYVYKAPSWSLHTTLTSPGDDSGRFGTTVAVSDANVIVAADQDEAFYAFSGSSYGSSTALSVPLNTVALPLRISADGSVITANTNENVYIFHGSSWGTRTELSPPSGHSGVFAESSALSADGTSVLVTGQANYSYIFSGSGWDTVTSLGQPVAFESDYGTACAIDESGEVAIISAPGVTVGGTTSAGKAYAFEGPDDYTSITADPPSASELLGLSLALSGDHGTLAAGGISDRVVVFTTDIGGEGWGLLL